MSSVCVYIHIYVVCKQSESQADTFGRGPAHDRLGIAQGGEKQLDHLGSNIEPSTEADPQLCRASSTSSGASSSASSSWLTEPTLRPDPKSSAIALLRQSPAKPSAPAEAIGALLPVACVCR